MHSDYFAIVRVLLFAIFILVFINVCNTAEVNTIHPAPSESSELKRTTNHPHDSILIASQTL